ncbi:DNA recombination protein RmuC [Candidatus Microgenomates bacterium]|nr:DNA recombination protein RmuC [Candidatus Microgenomates bacterium]
MDFLLILLIVVLIVLVIVLILRKEKSSPELLEYLRVTNQRLEKQGESFNQRLDNASRIIAGVQKNIGEFSEIGRGMKELQQFLSSPKLRGNMGEQVLKELLIQFLPKQSYKLQHTFKSGEKVDAAIITSGGIIPVDSKFPMENFRKMHEGEEKEKKVFARQFERDVKKHIVDISKKYILTEEGTIDYALMYIPSESVYYEVVNSSDLFDFAQGKRVLPVSPTTFYAYIKAILMSFEGQKIEKQAGKILASLRAVKKDYEKVEDNLGILQKHLTNAHNMMSNVFDTFSKLGQKISNTQHLESGIKKE